MNSKCSSGKGLGEKRTGYGAARTKPIPRDRASAAAPRNAGTHGCGISLPAERRCAGVGLWGPPVRAGDVRLSLQAKKLDGQTTQKDRGPCQSMAVSLDPLQRQEIHSGPAQEHGGEHGGGGDDAKDSGHDNEIEEAAFGSGIHQERNQRFAGPEDEDRKENPRREALYGLYIVDMRVLTKVAVRMDVVMRFIRHVRMRVLMRVAAIDMPDAPDQVGQTEGNEQPCGDTTAEGFRPRQTFDRQTQRHTNKAQYDRTANMAQGAHHGNESRSRRGPLSSPRHHNERQIVIGSQQCVDETY